MSNSWKMVLVLAVIIILAIFVGMSWKDKTLTEDQNNNAQNTESVDEASLRLDAELNSLDADLSATDESLNDEPVPTE